VIESLCARVGSAPNGYQRQAIQHIDSGVTATARVDVEDEEAGA
jgi:hypothetical protein